MSLDRWAHGPDSYEQRPAQGMSPALEAEAERRLKRIREKLTPYETLFDAAKDGARDLGYIEGLHDGLSFGVHGTLFKNHLLTLGDYEETYGTEL